ncbi:peptidase M28 [Candidatus Koribacter versatilis Ellin345]|uniref:Peptidase M28 n=1 Tax=Koribacter versatilis (strain Ellin345) TaxID=204669 RepID=Q1ITI9_KORVE|nr:M28 family metallopeptidase [Candidatus Koribacter versatilis]ABF39811.1 peptidase M28 [Candidatus Koribacter versatilis Ellin345]
MRNAVLLLIAMSAMSCAIAQGSPEKPKSGAKQSAASVPASAQSAINNVNPEIIRAHVRFLSLDLLEGRGTGQRGGDIAAEYIGTQFASYGLKPIGDNGSYLQKVEMLGIKTKPESSYAVTTEKGQKLDLKPGQDIVSMDETGNASDEIDAPIVWVGFGITAPEYRWDDYSGLDVKGKVLLMLVNEPPSTDPNFFKAKALTYYGRWTYKYEQAARMGAVGVILVHQTEMASYGWDVVHNSWGGERSYLRANNEPQLKAASWIQYNVAKQIFADSDIDIAKAISEAGRPGFKGRELNAHFKAHVESAVRPFNSYNVVAELQGSDSKLTDQAIMYSAHYDHLGIDPNQSGDNIYNGAADNATGCGILLEIARVMSASPVKPKRSVIFASVTAEEQGLRGSEYLGKNPPIPARNISLDLNFDDVPPIGMPEEVQVSGAERTTFYPVVEQTAKEFKLTIVPDSRPEAGHYYRSDHFSLARVGVPAFSVNEGEKFAGHDKDWGEKQAQDYNKNRYHQVTDEYKPEMDFSGDALMAKFGVALGWKAANQPNKVGWRAGDEFEKARKASEQ